MNDNVMGVKGTAATVPFVQAPNAMLRDKRLSSDARFFLAYVASFHEGWRFYAATVQQETGFGRDKLRKVMAEAERFGALRIQQERKPDGTMGGQVIAITWAPWAGLIAAELMRAATGD
jgi:hypothetical protein